MVEVTVSSGEGNEGLSKVSTLTVSHSSANLFTPMAGSDGTSHWGSGYEEFLKARAITDLLFLCSVGNLTRAKRVVEKTKVDITAESTADYDMRTPLHLAAACGNFSVVDWLITGGAPINALDRFGRTPLEDAVRGHRGDDPTDLVELLVKAGGKINEEGMLKSLDDSKMSGNIALGSPLEYDSWEIDPAELKDVATIGEGAFGVVKMCKWRGTLVAAKQLKTIAKDDKVALAEFRQEIAMMKHIHHPHIVQFLGASTQQEPYMLVTEYMDGGGLDKLFHSPSALSLQRATQLSLDTAKGMAYLHAYRSSIQVIHRDLKPGNLMLTQGGRLKVGDFGLSKSTTVRNRHDENEQYRMTGETGSYRYMAPEVFRHEPYNQKVDVYAFAMIMYQLFEWSLPFDGTGGVEAAQMAAMNGTRPNLRSHTPEPIKALLRQCWDQDGTKRPTFEKIVEELDKYSKTLPPVSIYEAANMPAPNTSACCVVQ